MTRKKTTPPRGGQPGNTNALKHCLYATALPTQYRQNLPQTTAGAVQAEIDLLRLLLANTLTGIAELTASSASPTTPPPREKPFGKNSPCSLTRSARNG